MKEFLTEQKVLGAIVQLVDVLIEALVAPVMVQLVDPTISEFTDPVILQLFVDPRLEVTDEVIAGKIDERTEHSELAARFAPDEESTAVQVLESITEVELELTWV